MIQPQCGKKQVPGEPIPNQNSPYLPPPLHKRNGRNDFVEPSVAMMIYARTYSAPHVILWPANAFIGSSTDTTSVCFRTSNLNSTLHKDLRIFRDKKDYGRANDS